MQVREDQLQARDSEVCGFFEFAGRIGRGKVTLYVKTLTVCLNYQQTKTSSNSPRIKGQVNTQLS